MKRKQKTYKRSKVNTFFFFLLLAIIFWLLTKFSREYTGTVKAQMNYRNIPESIQVAEINRKDVDLDVLANGFEFLYFKIKKPEVYVDIAPYYSDNNAKTIEIPKSELLASFTAQIGKTVNRTNIPGNTFSVTLDMVMSKTIPVVPKVNINYKMGFQSTDSIHTVPDSVTVSGPSEMLKLIDSIYTDSISVSNLESNFRENVGIYVPDSLGLTAFPETVELQLNVAEFSQKVFTLPIEVINLPPDITIKLIPETVEVTCNVPLVHFKDVLKSDFRLVCDYTNRNEENNFMVPKLIDQHSSARDIELSEKKIDYLIFK